MSPIRKEFASICWRQFLHLLRPLFAFSIVSSRRFCLFVISSVFCGLAVIFDCGGLTSIIIFVFFSGFRIMIRCLFSFMVNVCFFFPLFENKLIHFNFLEHLASLLVNYIIRVISHVKPCYLDELLEG